MKHQLDGRPQGGGSSTPLLIAHCHPVRVTPPSTPKGPKTWKISISLETFRPPFTPQGFALRASVSANQGDSLHRMTRKIEGLGCLLGFARILPEFARNSLGKRPGPAMRRTLHSRLFFFLRLFFLRCSKNTL